MPPQHGKRTCNVDGCDRPIGGNRRRYCSDQCANRGRNGRRDLAATRAYYRARSAANRARRHADDGRACAVCASSLAGMRGDARFCSQACRNLGQDRAKVNAYAAAYRKAHPDKIRAHQRTRDQRLRRAGGRITPRDWARLVSRYAGTCAYCGVQPWTDVDHVIPVSRGGRHTIGNVLPACRSCNASKSSRLLVEWRGYARSRYSGSAATRSASRQPRTSSRFGVALTTPPGDTDAPSADRTARTRASG